MSIIKKIFSAGATDLVNSVGNAIDKIHTSAEEKKLIKAEVNKAIQERNSDIQNFSAKLQKQVTDYQWKQGQYQMLNAEYNQGLQNFIGRVPDQKRN